MAGKITAIAIVVAIFVLALSILLPYHFSYLNYYEYGFARRKSTGAVDTSRVYTTGRHGIGIDFEFKVFKATAHNVVLHNINIFTKDKISIGISIAFQYFIRKDDLQLLHDAFDLAYEQVMESSAEDAIKAFSSEYSLHQYFKDRRTVEEGIFRAVRSRLSGDCCETHCQINSVRSSSDLLATEAASARSRCPGCKIPYSSCKAENKGLYVDVRYLQVRDVDIPADVQDRYLSVLIQGAQAEREKFVQESKIVEKETKKMVEDIMNEAAIIQQNGTAQAELIRSRAEADAKAIVQKAHADGLERIYRELGITQAKHKASFNYLRSLKQSKNKYRFTVGYSTAILGPLGGGT